MVEQLHLQICLGHIIVVFTVGGKRYTCISYYLINASSVHAKVHD